MTRFESGQAIGHSLGTIIFPFVLAYLLVWIYEKIRHAKIAKRRTLKIIILGLILLVITVGGQYGGR